jgi:hypothetical protein
MIAPYTETLYKANELSRYYSIEMFFRILVIIVLHNKIFSHAFLGRPFVRGQKPLGSRDTDSLASNDEEKRASLITIE